MGAAALPAWAVWTLVGTSVASSAYMARTQTAAARYSAEVARQNASLTEFAARDAAQRGARDVEEHGRKVRSALGRQTVALAASGLDIDAGSSPGVLEATARMADLDLDDLRQNTWREVFGLAAQRTDILNQGRLAQYTGRSSAVGSLLSGATTALGTYRTARGY